MNIYVWNLDFQFTDEDLERLFEGYGKVVAASIFRDKRTRNGKCSGFVEMPSASSIKMMEPYFTIIDMFTQASRW